MKSGLVRRFSPLVVCNHDPEAAVIITSATMPLETQSILLEFVRHVDRTLGGSKEVTEPIALMRRLARVPACYDAFCRAALSFLAAFSIGLANYPAEHVFLTLESHLTLDVMPAVMTKAVRSGKECFLGAFLAETLVFTVLARSLAHERVHMVKSIIALVKQMSLLADRIDRGIAKRIHDRLLPSLFNDGRTIRVLLEAHSLTCGRPSPFDGSTCDFFETTQRRLDWTTAPVRFGGFQHALSLPLRHALPNLMDGPLLIYASGSQGAETTSSTMGGKYADYVASGQAAVRALTEGRASALKQQAGILPLCAVSAVVRHKHLKNEDRWWLTHLAMDVGGFDDIEDMPLLFERIQGHGLETKHRSHIQSKMQAYTTEVAQKGLATPGCETMQNKSFYKTSERRLTSCPFAPMNNVGEEDLRELLIAQGVGFSEEAIETVLAAARSDTAGSTACLAHFNELLAIIEPSGTRREADRPLASPPFFVFGQAIRKQRRRVATMPATVVLHS